MDDTSQVLDLREHSHSKLKNKTHQIDDFIKNMIYSTHIQQVLHYEK